MNEKDEILLKVCQAAQARYPGVNQLKKTVLQTLAEELGYSQMDYTPVLFDSSRRLSFGIYSIAIPSDLTGPGVSSNRVSMELITKTPTESQILENVPAIDDKYVPWGNFHDILTVINTGLFFPVFITGLSGNGKTLSVEQACAQAGRALIRIQVSPETDENDLIGGMGLVNGETVFKKGPVLRAMESGSILLIDEIDRCGGSNKIMCLQGIMEGKPIYVKKLNEIIHPAPGFNIISTANTKGNGSDSGQFSAASIIDEAFLERFSIALVQDFPPREVEKSIILNHAASICKNFTHEKSVDNLIEWASIIRKTYNDGNIPNVISTRRLCHIIHAYIMFNDLRKAILSGIARFEDDVRVALFDVYTKIDRTIQ